MMRVPCLCGGKERFDLNSIDGGNRKRKGMVSDSAGELLGDGCASNLEDASAWAFRVSFPSKIQVRFIRVYIDAVDRSGSSVRQ